MRIKSSIYVLLSSIALFAVLFSPTQVPPIFLSWFHVLSIRLRPCKEYKNNMMGCDMVVILLTAAAAIRDKKRNHFKPEERTQNAMQCQAIMKICQCRCCF